MYMKDRKYGVWNCARYMAIGSPPITWDLKHKWSKVGVHRIAALHVVMCTSAYPFGDKRRDVA
uniref:SFRICE_039387 n=1 Tax=Spodoptera frugiperda TaxID=7108 RepID=A0A2H1WK94_SPOFR